MNNIDLKLNEFKEEIINAIEKRKNDGILETENAEFLIKLINNADTKDDVLKLSILGTTYKRTGFHFDVRLEKNDGKTINYLKYNNDLSFNCADRGGKTHKLIIGDNYPALLNLLISYKRKIKVIYIDPPYGKDHLGEFAKTNYDNAITRDNLLSMLYPRLMLAKQLLRDDGVIFCSIDDRNQAYVKCLFDEVFGERNFVASLIWQKKKGGSQDSEYFAKEHEYILCYQKLDWDINDITEEYRENDFNRIINGKKAKILKLEKWGNHSLRTDRPTLYYPIKDPNGNDFFPVAPNGADGCWRKKPQTLDDEHIFWQEDSKSRLTPYEVIYFDEMKGKEKIIKTRTLFTEYGTSTDSTKEILSIFNNQKVFDTPKPIELIKHLLKISTSPSIDTSEQDIILDFFAGSGTTGHAVMELNREDGGKRQFILVTNNEKTEINPNGIAYDVTSKRLKRVMTGSCYDGTDNFKWLEKNKPYGDGLEVTEIKQKSTNSQNIFNEIDEKLYNKDFKDNIHDKIDWICSEFEITCRKVESDEEYKKRNGWVADNEK